MKQSFLIILAIFFVIICIICVTLINLQAKNSEILNENKEYENYYNKEILGTDIASLINKVVDKNEKNHIQKDSKGHYIENETNSIKIDLKRTTVNKTYPMEEIYNNNIAKFVQNFNLIKFKCTSIEYHKKTGKVSKLVFEELK